MKKNLATIGLVAIIIATVAYGATTFTTNYNLNKPGDRDRNYGALLRQNFDTIDAQMKINETTSTDHINDTVGAHAATAISSDGGTVLCPGVDDVEEYLDCLDGTFDPGTSGLVFVTGTQTITGLKTFSTTPKFSALSNGIVSITSGDGTFATGTFGSLDPLTTKGDLLVYETDSVRLPVGSDGQVLAADSANSKGVVWQDPNPKWTKITYAFGDLSSASTAFSVTALTLQAGEGLDAIVVHHTASFGGGAISAYTVEVGTGADPDIYSSAYDVFQGVSGASRQISNSLDVPNFTTTTDVTVTARSVGDNLDQATGGSVDIYIRTFTLP